jgi:hypothetical protein
LQQICPVVQHMLPQHVVAPVHVVPPPMQGAALHVPSQYGVLPLHRVAQPPQLSGSLSMFTQAPPQQLRPWVQPGMHVVVPESPPASAPSPESTAASLLPPESTPPPASPAVASVDELPSTDASSPPVEVNDDPPHPANVAVARIPATRRAVRIVASLLRSIPHP